MRPGTAIALSLIVSGVGVTVASASQPPRSGALVTSFGARGLARWYKTADRARAYAAVLQGTRPVVAVHGTSATGYRLLRLNADGSRDRTFGANGMTGRSRYPVLDVVQRPGGSLVTLTVKAPPPPDIDIPPPDTGPPRVWLDAYTRDGAPRADFGDRGRIEIPVGPADWGLQLLADNHGGIFVVTSPFQSPDPADSYLTVRHYDAHGALDTSYGSGGRATVPLAWTAKGSSGVVLDAHGGLVVVGFDRARLKNAVARLTPTGTLDRHYGSGGLTILSDAVLTICCMAPRPHGGVILFGAAYVPSYRPLLYAFTTGGRRDPHFAGHGRKVLGARVGAGPSALTPVAHGGYLLAATGPRDPTNAEVCHLTPTGRVNPSFGHHGCATAPRPRRTVFDINAIAANARRVLIAGDIYDDSVGESKTSVGLAELHP